MGRYNRIARQHVEKALEARNISELQALQGKLTQRLETSHENASDLIKLVDEAKCAIQELRMEKEEVKHQHSSVLEKLQAVIASGDKEAMKLARDEAKAAGVPKKDIARAFALAQVA